MTGLRPADAVPALPVGAMTLAMMPRASLGHTGRYRSQRFRSAVLRPQSPFDT